MDEIISIVIPFYNEEGNITKLADSISEVMGAQDWKYEVIMINDGSSDSTWKKMKDINEAKPNFIGINFAGNYGQSSAIAAGIDYASGEYIVTLDGDLQNDPKDIPMMLNKLIEEDWDVVAGERENRQDAAFSRKLPSKFANFLIRVTTGVKMKDYGCTLRVFKKDIAKNLGLYGELHRFIPVLAILQGASMVQVPVKHHPRIHGKSKYGINRTFKVMSDLILMVFFQKYMQRPMHIFGALGIFTFGVGAIINVYLVILKILGQDIWGKPLLMLAVLLTLGGIQLITIGIMAEMQMRTYYESQRKTPYRIKKILKGEE